MCVGACVFSSGSDIACGYHFDFLFPWGTALLVAHAKLCHASPPDSADKRIVATEPTTCLTDFLFSLGRRSRAGRLVATPSDCLRASRSTSLNGFKPLFLPFASCENSIRAVFRSCRGDARSEGGQS